MKKIKLATKTGSTNKKTINRGGKKMIKNFVIGSKDAKLVSGTFTKPKETIAAVKAVKGVEGIKEVKAVPMKKDPKTGKVIQEAVQGIKEVKEVKAVKEVVAREAAPGSYLMKIEARTKEIAKELENRMADQGLELESSGDAPGGAVILAFKAETDKTIRAAFKKCKSQDGYNASGLAIIAKVKKAGEKDKKKKDAKDVKNVKDKTSDTEADWPKS